MRFSIRLFTLFAFASFLALAACGDPESGQRKEFIEFLQTRILDKKGSHVPELSDNQKEAFGPYAKDYAIIYDFGRQPGAQSSFDQLKSIQSRGNLRSLGDLASRRDDVVKAVQAIDQFQTDLDREFAAANAAKAALKQPDDLKAVYDQAYDRDVTQTVAKMKQVLPTTKATFQAMVKLADFMVANKDKLEINGMIVNAKDQATLTALQPLLNDVNAKGQALMQAAQSTLNDIAETQSGD